jgi:alkanesulfonate monooxygenase SsuD/methylene tetrahydromethanopterin reductase-like flavin-dependent oxidoreductase (luciferase family)
MKIGLQVPSFTWPGGNEAIAPTFARIARTADEAGFDSLWVMDHFFQIRGIGPEDEPMLEGWSALAFASARQCDGGLGALYVLLKSRD